MRSGQYLRLAKEREEAGGKTLCNYEETYFSPSFFPLSVRTAGVSCVGAKAGGGGGGGGSGIPPPSMPAPRGGSAHYNYPPRTFETNVLGREGRCQQRLLQADTSFSHTEHERKGFLERKRWNGTGRQEEDKEFPRKNSKRRFCPSFGFCPFLVSLLRDVPPPLLPFPFPLVRLSIYYCNC